MEDEIRDDSIEPISEVSEIKSEEDKNRVPITEEMGLQKEWYSEARHMTMEKLPEFLKKLTEVYEHDYGTICHAISAGAIATAWAMDHTPQGGITGFQASCIMWGIIQHWMSKENSPMRLLDYEDMLYPQYEDKFKTISRSTWNWLQEKAPENLSKGKDMNPDVREHMLRVSYGIIPFGYGVVSE